MYSEADLRAASLLVKAFKKGTILSSQENIFGDRTWADVNKLLVRRMTRKFTGRVQPADIEDAVASAMVDLVDYWVHLSSSVSTDDPHRNFNYALTRGTWMASTFVMQRLYEQANLVPLDEQIALVPEMIDPGPMPEDFEKDEEQVVQEFLATLPDEEFSSWLSDYLAGRTERESAQRQGVYRNAVHERRVRGLRRIRQRYHAYVVA